MVRYRGLLLALLLGAVAGCASSRPQTGGLAAPLLGYIVRQSAAGNIGPVAIALYSDGTVIYQNPEDEEAWEGSDWLRPEYYVVRDIAAVRHLLGSEEERRAFALLKDRVDLPEAYVNSVLDGGGYVLCLPVEGERVCEYVPQLSGSHVGRSAEEACQRYTGDEWCPDENAAHRTLPLAFSEPFARLWQFESSEGSPWYPDSVRIKFIDATGWRTTGALVTWPPGWPTPDEDACSKVGPACEEGMPGVMLPEIRRVLGSGGYARIGGRVRWVLYRYDIPGFPAWVSNPFG